MILFLFFQIIFSYLFLPFVYVMGVPTEEARQVSSVLGLKLVTSEILAFMELGQLRAAHAISVSIRSVYNFTYFGRNMIIISQTELFQHRKSNILLGSE